MIAPERVAPGKKPGSWLSDLGLRLSEWFEHWFPDAFSLAAVAVVAVFGATLLVGSSPMQSAQWFGEGFWDLVAFTMQMALIILTGYAVATSGPVFAIIRRLAGIPKTGRSAAAFVGLFSMLSSLLSWSFSLIFSALLAQGSDAPRARRRLSRRRRRGIPGHRQRLGARAVIVGRADHGGARRPFRRRFSRSAASSRSARRWVSGRASRSRWSWASLSYAICYYSAPEPRTGAQHGRHGRRLPADARRSIGQAEKPGEWLEYSPLLTIFLGGCGIVISRARWPTKGAAIILDLNHFVFAFLIAGLLLHWRPRSFTKAISAGRAVRGGRADPVSALRRDREDDDRVGAGQEDGRVLHRRVDAPHVSAARRRLFRVPRTLHSLGRRQMAGRGALYAGRRQLAPGASGLGGADLQCDRSAGQPDSSVLDAAAAGDSRPQGPRHRRLLDAAVRRARAGRAVSGLDAELHAHLRAARSCPISRCPPNFRLVACAPLFAS